MAHRGIRHSGFVVWFVLAALVVGIVGAWQYSEYKARKRAAADATLAAAAEQAVRDRVERERKATEVRSAQAAAAKDALTASLKKVDDLIARWEDALRVANNTARIQLSTPVATLQSLRREAGELVVPPCLDTGKVELVKAMDAFVEGFLAFMRNEAKIGEVLAQPYFESATVGMKEYRRIRSECPR